MRKLIVATLVLVLPLLSGNGCGKERKCNPHSVRIDSYQPGRWWVCNNDGTKEDPVHAPTPLPTVFKIPV